MGILSRGQAQECWVEAVAAIRKVARPRMPVANAEGEVVGIVLLTEAFQAVSRRETLSIKALLHEVPVVSDRTEALDVIEILQRSEHHFVLVYDEYGHFEGILTTDDVLEAITGAIAASEADEPAMVEREDGSYQRYPDGEREKMIGDARAFQAEHCN